MKPVSAPGPRLKRAVRSLNLLQENMSVRPKYHLVGQPFDRLLLAQSNLYRRSRRFFLQNNGVFEPSLISSPRSLSSATLYTSKIQYTPIENELTWEASHRAASQSARLSQLRGWVTNVFHEQNHRTLWQILPPPPRRANGPESTAMLRRYLNLAESLVITLDMALADEIQAAGLARNLWIAGPLYDPGSRAKIESSGRRAYRNYLHAALLGTWLNLEGYNPARLPDAVRALFPFCPSAAERATHRACNLDRLFVERTNPWWQARHGRAAARALLQANTMAALELPQGPPASHLIYLWGERVLVRYGL